MTDLLERRIRANKRNAVSASAAMASPPRVEEPKSMIAEIRSIEADEDFSVNLSRAVVKYVWNYESEPLELEEETDEPHTDWRAAMLWLQSAEYPATEARAEFLTGHKRHCFMGFAKRLDERGQTDVALDLIFDQIDEMLLGGDFDSVNQLLRDVATDDFSTEILLGVLTVTLPAKGQLPDRHRFFHGVKASLESRNELKDGLLVGLD